jgi:hypothetical protein
LKKYIFDYIITLEDLIMKRNIEIINITPRGFCNGVVKAIIMINNVLKENKYKKPLYIYGLHFLLLW